MLKKIGAITAVDALTKVLGYLLLPVYLGLMPKIEFGEFGFLTSAVGSASLVLGLSMYVPLIKNYCSLEKEVEKKNLVSTVFTILSVWIVLIDVALIALKPICVALFESFFEITESADHKYYLSILLINSGIINLYCYSLVVARTKTTEIIFFTATKFTLTTIFSLLLLYTNPWNLDSVTNRMLTFAITELAIAFAFLFTIYRKYISLAIDKDVFKSNFKIALPLIPSAIIGVFMAVIDRRLISKHHGLDELADYNLAMLSLAPIQMVMSAIQVAWAPHIFSLKNNSQVMNEVVRLMLIALATMVTSSLIVFYSVYLSIKFGFISIKYDQVPMLILFVSIGTIAASLTHLTSNVFVKIEKTGVAFVLTLLTLLVNWLTNLVLVPHYASYGSAFASGIANLLSLTAGLIVLFKLVDGRTK